MLTRKKLMWIVVPIVGMGIFAFVYYTSKNKDNIPILPESDVAIESSNTSIAINSSNSSNDLNLPAPNPTSTIATQFTPIGTGVTSSTPIGTGVTQSTSTGTDVTPSTPTGIGANQSTTTSTSSPKPTSTSTSSSKPSSTSTSSSSSKPTSSSSTSSSSTASTSSINSDPPVVPPSDYLHTEECNGGWIGLTTDHAGDAFIDGSFLSKNKIGKVENGRKINGWMFNLYIDGASMSLIVCPNQSGFSCESKATYENAPAFEHPVHITAEYAENNDLKISFIIEDYSFDLTTLYKISVTSSTTPVASPSSYPRTVYDDNNNGWVGLMDGQTGDAYIYGGFIDEIYNGLKINLYTHGISVSLFVYFDQNGFYYESKQITTYDDAPTYEWPIQISAEYTENDGLMVSFFVEGQAFDLTSLYKVTIETI